MAKILVTGGAGFIGSHTTVALMRRGFEVVILDNFSNSETFIIDRIAQLSGISPKVYREDCRNQKALQDILMTEQPEGIIHFAAYKAVGESVKEPLKYYDNNIGSMVSLLAAMNQTNIQKLVFSSSCTVYGQPDEPAVTEDSPLKMPTSPYGYTKQVCENLLLNLANSGSELQSVVLRYFNPIGADSSGLIGELPRGVPNNLVPYITQTAAGLRSELQVFGNDYDTPDGTCVRDYIHVTDLAEAHVASLEWLQQKEGVAHEVFNLGTGRGSSVLEVVKTFEAETGMPLNWKFAPRRDGDVAGIWAKPDKAAKMLNWRTRFTLQDALRDAWRWQQNLGK